MAKKIVGTPQAKVIFITDDVKYQIVGTLDDPLSEILQISTTKTLGNPSGSFSISLVPRKDSNGKTWFDKLDAFDYVEIAFRGVNDKDFRVTMRGLIDTVHKSESWEGGVPARSISITGRDLGALLTDFNLYFMPELDVEASILKDIVPMGSIEMMNSMPKKVGAKFAFEWIMKLFQKACTLKLGISSTTIEIKNKIGFKAEAMFPNDETNVFYLRGYEGPYWNAFARYEDKPFHELFIYDGLGSGSAKEKSLSLYDKSYLILRPSRLHDCNGKPSPSVTALESDKILYPDGFTVDDDDIMSMEVEKSVHDVKNYFFTYPDLSFLGKVNARGFFFMPYKSNPQDCNNPFFQTNRNYSAWIGKFGFRKMEATTVFVDLEVGQGGEEPTKTYQQSVLPAFMQKGIDRNIALVAWYLHNQFLLSGSIVIRGTNQAIIGTYLTHGGANEPLMEYYIEGVSQNFVILETYTTSLTLSRGMPTSGVKSDAVFGINPKNFGKTQNIEKRG